MLLILFSVFSVLRRLRVSALYGPDSATIFLLLRFFRPLNLDPVSLDPKSELILILIQIEACLVLTNIMQ